MKYIVIQEKSGSEFAVFCLAPQTHAQLATAWRRDDSRRVVAAGFAEFLGTGHAIVFGRSESLNIGNRGTKDAALITAMYFGTVAMARAADGFQQGGFVRGSSCLSTLTGQVQKFDYAPAVQGGTETCHECGARCDDPGICADCLSRQQWEAAR